MKKFGISKQLFALSAIIVSLSIGYYFVVHLPTVQTAKIAKEKEADLYLRKQNCAKQSQEYYENLKKEVNQGTSVLNPKYHYNPSLGKCFYSGGTLQGNVVSKYIVDISENEEVVTYLSEVGGKAILGDNCNTCVELEEFKAKERELLER